MKSNTEIDNRTTTETEGIPELMEDFLYQLKYEKETEISVVLCDNKFIRELNQQYRGKDKPTDVLSFPANMDFFLGDIVISLEKAREQATKGLVKELEMLLCHGLLHLLGYDHEESDEAYEEMMSLQQKLLNNKTKELKVKWV